MSKSGRYTIPARRHRVEDEVKNSRFITTIAPAPTVDEARAFVETVRREFGDATHNCWAFVVGPPGSTEQNGSSDDGEPGGTAGRPILSTLLSSGVGDVAAVVTRYFGGVKLGRGGLVRAYGGGVLHALRDLPRKEKISYARVRATVAYAFVESVRRAAAEFETRIDGETFGEAATFELRVPEERCEEFERTLAEITSGGCVFEKP